MIKFRDSRIDYSAEAITLTWQNDRGNKMSYTYPIDHARKIRDELDAALTIYDKNKDSYTVWKD